MLSRRILVSEFPIQGVVFHDGSDPVKMHNFYPIIYNETVFRAIESKTWSREAVLFARSSYASGQRFPVHWGGDCWSTFESMAESLRGGLSLSLSGFGFWSHDIGGFEGTSPAFIYKRWTALWTTFPRIAAFTAAGAIAFPGRY